jgi:ribosomal protein S8
MVRRLGDIGTAKPAVSIENLADALLKIKTTGKVSAKALTEFAKAGIEVSDVIGMDATTALNTLMERMNKFDGYLENEATDIWSQIPRIVETVQDALAELGNYINDNFKQYFVALGNTVSDLRDEFVKFLNDEGGMAELQESIIDIVEAITIMALPALAQMAVAMAPITLKAIAFIAALEGIRDLMKALRGEGSVIVSTFKAVFSQLASSVMDLAENVAQLNVDLMEMAMNAAAAVNNDVLYALTGKGYDSAKSIRNRVHSLRKPVDEQTDEFWKEVEKNATKASDTSIIGYVSSLLGKTVGTYEGNLNAGTLGPKARKKQQVSRVTANNPESSDSGSSTQKDDTKVYNTTLWDDLKRQYKSFKNVIVETYDAGKQKVEEYLEEQEKERQKALELKQEMQDFKVSIAENLANGFTEALFAGENFFKSMGNMLENLGKQLLAQITQMLVLTTLFRAFGIGYDIKGLSAIPRAIDDGIVQNGKVITTDPRDYIIATKNPESLGGSGNDGQPNVVINVQNNSISQVSADSFFDGTRTIVDIVIDGLQRNVNGLRDTVRAI